MNTMPAITIQRTEKTARLLKIIAQMPPGEERLLAANAVFQKSDPPKCDLLEALEVANGGHRLEGLTMAERISLATLCSLDRLFLEVEGAPKRYRVEGFGQNGEITLAGYGKPANAPGARIKVSVKDLAGILIHEPASTLKERSRTNRMRQHQ